MTRGGWRWVRRAWRVCAWIGCKDEIVAPAAMLCAFHFHERERVEAAMAEAQIPFRFYFPEFKIVPRVTVDVGDTQLDFGIPYPKLHGAHAGHYQDEKTFEEVCAELRQQDWIELKERNAARKRELDKWRVKDASDRQHETG
jgi:hypothetical protein